MEVGSDSIFLGSFWDHEISYWSACTWMSQEVSKRLGSVGYNPNISHLQVIDPKFLPGTS